MPRLTRLSIDMTSNGVESSMDLDVLLLLLCRPHDGAVQLKHLVCTCRRWWTEVVDAELVRVSVLRQLDSCFGVTGVNVEVVRL